MGSDPEWHPTLGISGAVREGLVASGNSRFSFRTSVGPRARLRAHYAILPDAWETFGGAVEFAAGVQVGSSSTQTVVRSKPSTRWRDRRWRGLYVTAPVHGGDAIVSLETRVASDDHPSPVPLAWGDLVLEWPRSAADRRALLVGAFRRLRAWGFGGTLAYALGRRNVDDQSEAYRRWVAANHLGASDLEALRVEVERLPWQPVISIITPVHNTPPAVLSACLQSVQSQVYRRLEHCIADDGSTDSGTQSVLRQYSDDARVRVTTLETSQHVSAASNAALSRATGEFVALLDHDDELAPEALVEVVRYLNAHPDADIIYSDEDKLDAAGDRCDPYFKPDWSPELFLSYMYTCHLTVIRRQLLDEVGGFRVGFEGAQDYDLMLRLMGRTDRIHHIPRILYHWRKGAGSTAAAGSAKPWAIEAGRRALEDFGRRTGTGTVVDSGPHPGMYRLRRVVRGEPLVSIVIPTTGRPHATRGDLLAQALRSLHKTAWRNFEIVVSTDENQLTDAAKEALGRLPHVLAVYGSKPSFNFSHKVNEAVRQARGEHVVLFNDDLEVLSPDWLTAMLEFSQNADVGAVGAKLFYPDGRIQHIGMLIGVCGLAAHAFHRYPGRTDGYGGSAVVARNYSAVTAACLMTRTALFRELGGLDEELPVDFNDVDFCLRVRAGGYRVVFAPDAQLVHHESASFGRRIQNAAELSRMRQKWGAVLERDPYYNPNLSKTFSDYRIQG